MGSKKQKQYCMATNRGMDDDFSPDYRNRKESLPLEADTGKLTKAFLVPLKFFE